MQLHNPFKDICAVVDITEEDDFTSEFGYNKVKSTINENAKVARFASFPCTGGCPFNLGTNSPNPKCREKLDGHIELFKYGSTPCD